MQTNNWNGTEALFDELNSRFAGSSLHVQYVYVRLHVRLVITLRTFTFYYSWRCKRLNINSNFVELELFPNEISFLVTLRTVARDIAIFQFYRKFDQILKNNSLPVLYYIKRLGKIQHDVNILRNKRRIENKHGNLFHQ